MRTIRELREAHTPEQLEAAKTKHSDGVHKKTKALARNIANGKKFEKIDGSTFTKNSKAILKTYRDLFKDRARTSSQKLGRHNQALRAIDKVKSPRSPRVTTKQQSSSGGFISKIRGMFTSKPKVNPVDKPKASRGLSTSLGKTLGR